MFFRLRFLRRDKVRGLGASDPFARHFPDRLGGSESLFLSLLARHRGIFAPKVTKVQ
jgi:hypothetical protein